MTTHELKFTKGTRSLIISTGRYGLGADFVPPATSWALNMSGSTSANRYGGANVISRRAVNSDFAFTVYVAGSSSTEVNRGVTDLAQMIDLAGDENEPLYLEWRENSELPIPLWGQFGAPLRLEVVNGSISRDTMYGMAGRRGDKASLMVGLTVKPFWVGMQQKLLQVADAVIEDRGRWYTDQVSRGLIIGTGITNKMTNPVFGNIADPDNGWTATTVVAEINNDLNYVLFHDSSVKVVASGGTGRLTQSINVGDTANYLISCYAKLPDGSAVSATQCAIYYGAAEATSYTAVGNGWYRLVVAHAGIASATAVGIQVESGYTVYVDGFQIEADNDSAVTPLAYGDMVGCAWTSTAHGSTTTRSEGFARLAYDVWSTGGDRYVAGVRHLAEFSIVMTVKMAAPNTYPYDMHLINAGAVSFYFKAADDKYYLTDGTNTCSSAAQTFAAGDIIQLAIVCQPGEIRIYKNGASVASAAAYDQADPGTIYLGSDSAPDYQFRGTIQGCTIYDVGLSQAYVTAIYAASTPMITAGYRVDFLPWQHTAAGDDITDAQYISADRDWRVIDGIPGNIPAETILDIAVTSSAGIVLNLNAVDEFQDMTASFKNCQGTAVAGTLDGEVDRSSAFTTAETTIPESAERITLTYPYQNYQNKQIYLAAAIIDNGTGLLAKPSVYTSEWISGEWQALAADTSNRFFLIGPITTPQTFYNKMKQFGPVSLVFGIICKRTGGSATVDIDYYRVLFGKTCYVPVKYAVVNGNRAWFQSIGADYIKLTKPLLIRGDVIEFEPNKINYFTTIPYLVAETVTSTKIADAQMQISGYVIPRWSII